MNPTEVWNLVRLVYASYNQYPFDKDKKILVEAWTSLLGEYDYEAASRYAMEVASISKVMPTPGGIRRYIIDRTMADRPPTVQEAWAWLQQRSTEMNSGTWSEQTPHPVIVETMKALGSTAIGLHTNGDRDYFTQVYNAKLQQYDIATYKVNNEA